MGDNRQTASTLSLVAGILSAVFAVGFFLVMGFVTSFFSMAAGMDMMRSEGGFVAMAMGMFIVVVVLVHAAAAVVFLMAAPRLKSDDPQVRRTWAVWAIVVGAISLLGPVGIVIAGLGIAAGVVTLSDLSRAGL